MVIAGLGFTRKKIMVRQKEEACLKLLCPYSRFTGKIIKIKKSIFWDSRDRGQLSDIQARDLKIK
jgi:hypothetical protein